MFLGKTVYFPSASLYPGVKIGTGKLSRKLDEILAGGGGRGGDNLAMDQHSIEGQVVILLVTSGNRNKLCLKGQLGLRTDFALLIKILSFWLLWLPFYFSLNIFSVGFLLELQKDGGKMADAATLLSISDYIHLVLIKTDPSGDTTLIGSHFLPWRDILSAANGRLTSAVEINGVGAEAKVPMGILEIKFEIIPRLSQVRLDMYVHEQLFSFLFTCISSAGQNMSCFS